ncbi:death domain-associated protein 6, partial [Passerculus sandwichensis]
PPPPAWPCPGGSPRSGGGRGRIWGAPPPSPLPDSTRADSPGGDLVSSSQGSPPRMGHPKTCKTSVGTQCDPEEIIVLSDSD